jgi:hypothetical protein
VENKGGKPPAAALSKGVYNGEEHIKVIYLNFDRMQKLYVVIISYAENINLTQNKI